MGEVGASAPVSVLGRRTMSPAIKEAVASSGFSFILRPTRNVTNVGRPVALAVTFATPVAGVRAGKTDRKSAYNWKLSMAVLMRVFPCEFVFKKQTP